MLEKEQVESTNKNFNCVFLFSLLSVTLCLPQNGYFPVGAMLFLVFHFTRNKTVISKCKDMCSNLSTLKLPIWRLLSCPMRSWHHHNLILTISPASLSPSHSVSELWGRTGGEATTTHGSYSLCSIYVTCWSVSLDTNLPPKVTHFGAFTSEKSWSTSSVGQERENRLSGKIMSLQ